MAGSTRTTGYSGPPPNPNARRRNKRDVDPVVLDADEEMVTAAGETSELPPEVQAPAPNDNWHPIARQLWDGLVDGVVSRLYEPSDWSLAYMLCEDYSRELKPRKIQVGLDGMGEPILVEMEMPMPGAKLTALLRGLNSLIATEGDRRRLQIEVKRKSHIQHGADSKTAKQRVTQNRLELLQGGQSA